MIIQKAVYAAFFLSSRQLNYNNEKIYLLKLLLKYIFYLIIIKIYILPFFLLNRQKNLGEIFIIKIPPKNSIIK